MMTTNLFVIANVKQLRTGGSFRILQPFFWTSWGVGNLNSAVFNSFQNRGEFCTILEGLGMPLVPAAILSDVMRRAFCKSSLLEVLIQLNDFHET
jgi:hypothetical protein